MADREADSGPSPEPGLPEWLGDSGATLEEVLGGLLDAHLVDREGARERAVADVLDVAATYAQLAGSASADDRRTLAGQVAALIGELADGTPFALRIGPAAYELRTAWFAPTDLELAFCEMFGSDIRGGVVQGTLLLRNGAALESTELVVSADEARRRRGPGSPHRAPGSAPDGSVPGEASDAEIATFLTDLSRLARELDAESARRGRPALGVAAAALARIAGSMGTERPGAGL